jgi:phage shock protein A
MFKEIGRVFRASLDAFLSEAGKREPEDEVAELLSSMRRELTEARAALPLYGEDVARIGVDLRREKQLLEDCERRGTAAERIGDAETARIAAEFAGRHAERASVLERKLGAAEAERELREREADEMAIQYREADLNRFGLVAELRRVRTGQMLDAALNGYEAPPPPSASEVEERLQELKRRMGR